jgi:holdfast attachment protein HfaA
MPSHNAKSRIAVLSVLAVLGLAGTAQAGGYDASSSYNNPYGMTGAQENQTVNPSLRDANGNLTMVNGQITSATFGQQTGVSTATAGGSGTGAMYGGATAIGNNLNVVTTGNNNTVIVTSQQNNSGDVTANVKLNGQ